MLQRMRRALAVWLGLSVAATAAYAGIAVKLSLGRVDHYFPVTPQESWQNTGIRLQKDEEFSYAVVGRVSPGFLQDADRLARYVQGIQTGKMPAPSHPAISWPFTGPEGYDPKWYEEGKDKLKAITVHFRNDGG